jgi:preprotein translocase subunit SecD
VRGFAGRVAQDGGVSPARRLVVTLLAIGLLAALAGCSTSSAGGTAPTGDASGVGKGAQNFQMRPVLSQASGGATRCPTSIDASPDPAAPTVACSIDQSTQYRLGPAFVTGLDVVSAAPDQTSGSDTWIVDVAFTAHGRKALLDATTAAIARPAPRNAIAVMVDGFVVFAPVPQGPIDGGIQLTGALDQHEATLIANRIVPSS